MRRGGLGMTVSVVTLLSASGVGAQTPTLTRDAAGERGLVVSADAVPGDAPPGLRLGLVAEVVGVPVVLEQASATADRALAQIRVRSTAQVPLTHLTLAVTAVRLAGGTPVRRTIPVAVALAPGDTSTVDITSVPAADLAAVWAPGETGALEVAVVGATASDGSEVVGDLGPPPFVPPSTSIECGDATWRPTVAGETAVEPVSGQVVECDRHGLWRPFVAGEQ